MVKILYITEVIASRRAGQPTGRYANADEAWESLVENYLPDEERAVFRQEENTVEGPKAGVKRKPRIWKTVLTRVASIVVAIVLVAAAGTVIASVFGFDFWAWLTAWTQEAFGIQNPNTEPGIKGAVPEQLSELHALMQEHGFPDRLLPTYLPEGYEADSVECQSNTTFVRLHCFLSKNDDFILLEYYFCEKR